MNLLHLLNNDQQTELSNVLNKEFIEKLETLYEKYTYLKWASETIEQSVDYDDISDIYPEDIEKLEEDYSGKQKGFNDGMLECIQEMIEYFPYSYLF